MHENGLIAGSFDPPTLGHLDLIRRAASFCRQLYVGIAVNSMKVRSTFSVLEREAMLSEICHDIPNLKIVEIPSLVVEYAKHHHIDFLVRGLRSPADFDTEFQMACANKKLCGIDTVFLLSDPAYSHISSTLIHEIAMGGYRLHAFVPTVIEDPVYTRITLKKSLEN